MSRLVAAMPRVVFYIHTHGPCHPRTAAARLRLNAKTASTAMRKAVRDGLMLQPSGSGTAYHPVTEEGFPKVRKYLSRYGYELLALPSEGMVSDGPEQPVPPSKPTLQEVVTEDGGGVHVEVSADIVDRLVERILAALDLPPGELPYLVRLGIAVGRLEREVVRGER